MDIDFELHQAVLKAVKNAWEKPQRGQETLLSQSHDQHQFLLFSSEVKRSLKFLFGEVQYRVQEAIDQDGVSATGQFASHFIVSKYDSGRKIDENFLRVELELAFRFNDQQTVLQPRTGDLTRVLGKLTSDDSQNILLITSREWMNDGQQNFFFDSVNQAATTWSNNGLRDHHFYIATIPHVRTWQALCGHEIRSRFFKFNVQLGQFREPFACKYRVL